MHEPQIPLPLLLPLALPVGLILRIDKLEHIESNKLIIAIHNNLYFSFPTKGESRIDVIIGGKFLAQVMDEGCTVFWEPEVGQLGDCEAEGQVGGEIIDEY